jgi:hypothetical protein
MDLSTKFIVTCGLALLGASVQAQDTLQLVNNTGLVENVTINGVGAGAGSYLGVFTPQGGLPVSIPQMFCVDLTDQVTWGQTWVTTETNVYNEAGWLADNYGAVALTSADQAAGLQLAIWQTIDGGGSSLNTSIFGPYNGDNITNAIADANTDLAAGYGMDAWAEQYTSYTDLATGIRGQSMIVGEPGGPNPNISTSAPGPAAIIPFALGLIGKARRRSKARRG